MPIKIIGLAWYKKENYERVISISKDGNIFARRFEDWLVAAEKHVSSLEAKGAIVIRAEIDPDTFPAWCAANGVDVDAKGRMAFGNSKAAEYIKNKQREN